MGLFSFGNKDAAPARRSRTSAGAERQGEARNARASRASAGSAGGRSGQESLLDPTLPEKQRARRRLVGAIALVLAAVVVLPMVLDSHPKPASGDIAVNIPRASKIPALQEPSAMNTPAPAQAGDTTTAEGSLADNPAPSMANNAESASTPIAAVQTSAVTPANHGAATSPGSPAQNNAGTAKASQPAPSHAASNTPASTQTSTLSNSAAPHAATGTTSAASRFVVSVGSFASDASAHAWLNKLKAAGVPAYLETKRLTDGTQRTLLRAGPFTDRATAEAAVKKVRDAGLSAQSSTPAQNAASGAAQ